MWNVRARKLRRNNGKQAGAVKPWNKMEMPGLKISFLPCLHLECATTLMLHK